MKVSFNTVTMKRVNLILNEMVKSIIAVHSPRDEPDQVYLPVFEQQHLETKVADPLQRGDYVMNNDSLKISYKCSQVIQTY